MISDRTKAEILAVLLVVCAALWWYQSIPPTQPVGSYAALAPSKEVKGVVKQEVKVVTVKAYPKKSKADIGLPPAIAQDDNQYVVAASSLRGDLHPHTIVSTLDTKTGEVTQTVRVDPYPWIAAEQNGEARVDYGIKNDGRRVGRLTVTESLVQIKELHIGVSATLDTDRAAFAGVGIGYRW